MTGSIDTRTLPSGAKRYDVRYRNAAGVQKTKTFTKLRAAETFKSNVAKSLADRTYIEVRPAPMAEVFDKWLAAKDVDVQEGSLRASTARSYRSVVNTHLRPHFAGVRSDRLALEAVEKWRGELAGKVGAGEMAPKALTNIRNTFSAVIRWARHPSRGYLAHDPVSGMKRLRLPRSKRRPHYEPEQLAELLRLAAATPSQDGMVIRLVVLSGLRRGEAFALRWRDVDFDAGRLHVRGTLDRGVVVGTKTEDSERAVDVPRELLDALLVHQVSYPPLGAEQFVFRQATGAPFDPDRWHRRVLTPLLRAAGLKLPGSGLHALRHSYVSLLGAQGADIKYIADQVGHTTTRLTQDLYTHVLRRQRSAAMAGLGAAIPSHGHRAEAAAAPENQG